MKRRQRKWFRQEERRAVWRRISGEHLANILMPIMNNLGYVQYVLMAMVGGALEYAAWQIPAWPAWAVITLG